MSEPKFTRRNKGAGLLRDDFGRKQCVTCKQWLDPVLFSQSKVSKDGLHAQCPRCARNRHMVKNYGITLVGFETLLQSQGGVCAICRVGDYGNAKNWHVDHDHETGAVRGILCGRCNVGVGMFLDDPQRLRAAITYLETTDG